MLQFSDQQDKKGQEMAEITRLEESATDNIVGKTTDDLLRVKGKLLEVFILNVSNISLVLVVKDGSGILCSIWFNFNIIYTPTSILVLFCRCDSGICD